MAVTIVPAEGQMKFIAQDLLFLADHPTDVQFVSRPEPGFLVSEELYERFVQFAERDVVEPVVVEVPATAPKRGRPKKNVEDQ